MFEVKIYTFASLRDGLSEEPEFKLSMDKISWINDEELKRHLFRVLNERRSIRFGEQAHLEHYTLPEPKTIMLAINETFVEPGKSIQLSQMDTIALIPPVSGG